MWFNHKYKIIRKIMRNLINWFRSLSCKHEFTYEETPYTTHDIDNIVLRRGIKVSRTCNKCGWHTSYWKY